ncbi:MAG: type II toxin-antitoxin system RelB/DinJ family antitoxin [Eggerthellaceae bacterium]|nr:type II toxin-antitoxin system RelB/DinJ family antitoxin [Eggerthellaceae bacterium]
MSTKLVTFKMDEQVKNDFDSFCLEVGLSASGMFNMFARTVIREKRIPFEINADPFYGERNTRALLESIKDADAGKFAATATVDEFDALMAGL